MMQLMPELIKTAQGWQNIAESLPDDFDGAEDVGQFLESLKKRKTVK